MKGIAKKQFPFSHDGIAQMLISKGDDFPPAGVSVTDSMFNGLVDAGYIDPVNDGDADNEALNRAIIEAIDRGFSIVPEEELMSLITRGGKTYSDAPSRAVMVRDAKEFFLRDLQNGISALVTAAPDVIADPAAEPRISDGDGEKTEPVVSEPQKQVDIESMTKAELEAFAAEKKIDISAAKTKADVMATINNKIALDLAAAS